MKPRLFIGSSLEGINYANAAQQNLHHTLEVVVWNQGVFQPSESAVDSLLEALNTFDFGLFVFSPDDVVRIRGEENRAVRDNVVFELGLFVAVLGRERCFIMIPEDAEDLHLPTDLVGMSPVRYETNRRDGNLQSATATSCQAVHDVALRRGLRPGQFELPRLEPDSAVPYERVEQSELAATTAVGKQVIRSVVNEDWFEAAFISRDFAKAEELLAQKIGNTEDEAERVAFDSWLGRLKHFNNARDGSQYLEALIGKYPWSASPFLHLSNAYLNDNYPMEALVVVERGLLSANNKSSLVMVKARCLNLMGRSSEVEGILRQAII